MPYFDFVDVAAEDTESRPGSEEQSFEVQNSLTLIALKTNLWSEEKERNIFL